ncbi:unnamed protein product [Linum trigynum]|uniref:Uncharacterized protein n=1 Tax=Linum trigynum TaxID=586398 RepID=A0AAV2D9K6_9ROSI
MGQSPIALPTAYHSPSCVPACFPILPLSSNSAAACAVLPHRNSLEPRSEKGEGEGKRKGEPQSLTLQASTELRLADFAAPTPIVASRPRLPVSDYPSSAPPPTLELRR